MPIGLGYLQARIIAYAGRAHVTKKHIILLPAFVLIFLFCCAEGAAAFQCGNGFISIGSFRDEVLDRCGPPAMSDSWQEERLVNPYTIYYGYGQQFIVPNRVLVTVDRWVYNFGPTKFMRILTFENARLIRIESGRTGY